MISAPPLRREIEHRGSVAKLRRELENARPSKQVLEVCVAGPRGTGKSNGVGYLLWKLCRKYPRSRVLVIRTARSLLTDTFCKTFEEDVCPGDECVSDTARTNRHEYVWPSNGSRIVLGGLDDCQRYYGSDWDIIVPEEAVQFTWKAIEPFLGSLRNGKMPFHAIIYPTNPDAPGHWLKKRCDDGLARMMECYHKDNPALYERGPDGVWRWSEHGAQFMATLSRYTGVQHERHVLGKWRGADGMVWPGFDERVHLIAEAPADLIEFRAAMDWGWNDTGVLLIYGLDSKKRIVVVDRVYQMEMGIEKWARTFVMLANEYNITRCTADPSQPAMIDLFGDWLVRAGKPRIVHKAMNKRATSPNGDLGGLELVRWGMERDPDGVPRIRFVNKPPRLGVCPKLTAAGRKTLGWDEIPEYVLATDSDGEVIGDRTDSKCQDDFCDALRYACTEAWPRSVHETPPPPIVYGANTYAGMVGTPESLMLAKLKRQRGME